MSAPLVSIVIPVYNHATYVGQAVKSALAQTLAPLEVLVLDDGSTDGSAEVVEAIKDPKLRLVRLEHAGAPAARNRGVAEAWGDFILWLDSDDVLEPGTIQAYAETLAEFPKAEVLHGKLTVTYPDLTPMDTLLGRDWYGRNHDLMRELVFTNPIANNGTMVAKACYGRVGGYDETFPRAHDYEFWTRLAPKAHFKYVRALVTRYRWHETNITGGVTRPDRAHELRIVLAHLERQGPERLFPELAAGPEGAREQIIERIAARIRDLGAPARADELALELRNRFASGS